MKIDKSGCWSLHQEVVDGWMVVLVASSAETGVLGRTSWSSSSKSKVETVTITIDKNFVSVEMAGRRGGGLL